MGSAKSKIRERINYNTKPIFNSFIKSNPDSGVTYTQFKDIIKESNLNIRTHILDNPLGFKLPYNFGYIAVDKFKPSGRKVPIDWKQSAKSGRKIPFLNLHSFGYTYKVKIYKNPSIRPLLGYNMDAHRSLKRMLAQIIKGGNSQHIAIDRTYFSKRFRIDKIIKQA